MADKKEQRTRVLVGWNNEQEANLGSGENLPSAIRKALDIKDVDVRNVMVQELTNRRTKLTEITDKSVPKDAQFIVFVPGHEPKLVTFP